MKFLVISDLHGEVAMLEKIDAEFKAADAVLFAGDFAKFNHTETGKPALEALCKKHDVIFSVIGNCDEPSFLAEVEAFDISCEKTLAWHEGLAFCGSGGGSKFSGATPNERSDEELAGDFDVVLNAAASDEVAASENGSAGEWRNLVANDDDKSAGAKGSWNNLIVVMHNPPKDTECDKIENGMHVGSPLLRAFIEKTKPLAVVTGHIHESAGIDKIGETVVVNPGSLAEGKYALMKVEKSGDEWKVVNCELRNVN